MMDTTDDLHIDKIRPLISPAILMEELPLTDETVQLIGETRAHIVNLLKGDDKRLLVIVGPCSIHDERAALEYADKLKEAADRYQDDLLIVMRVYFEKPRTTVGWKGLINDPDLNDSFNINKGLHVARRLLLTINEMGLPAAAEFLDTITPQYIADLISWGAIGARTTESQVHRELASGLSAPIGFKNGTDGNIQIALDAIRAAAQPHQFLSVTKQGLSAIVVTKGNGGCHLILRGGNSGPNHGPEAITETIERLEKSGLDPRVLVDCSHGNSGKDPEKQPSVADECRENIINGRIFGLMIESHLVGGNQKATPGCELVYGQSITDGCLGWEQTETMLAELASVAKLRK